MKTYRTCDHQLKIILSGLTMSERAEQITKYLDLEAKLRFYENWTEAVINGYFVFSDGSEIKVPVK